MRGTRRKKGESEDELISTWLSPCRLAEAGCIRRFSRGSQLLPSCPFASGLPLFLLPFPLQSWMFVISQHPAHNFMNNPLFNLPQITLLLLYFLFPAETWTDKLSSIKVCCQLTHERLSVSSARALCHFCLPVLFMQRHCW